MWEIIISFIANIFSSVIPEYLPKSEKEKYRNQFQTMRMEIAEALAMYACCYNNPIDIAKTNGQLPPLYQEGSKRIRELASKMKAYGEVLPDKRMGINVTRTQIMDVAGYLFGISNSFTTPYNCGISNDDLHAVREYVLNIRAILELSEKGAE